jgi:hypothetical protein
MGRKAANMEKEAPEKRRSDYGNHKRTDRDWEGMEPVGSMRFVRFDTLGELWDPQHQPALAALFRA